MSKVKRRTLFVIIILSSLLLSAVTALEPVFLQKVVDHCQSRQQHELFRAVLLLIGSIIGILVFEYIRKLTTAHYLVSKIRDLRKKVITRISHMRVGRFSQANAQDYVMMVNTEIDMLAENYYAQILDLTYAVLVLLTSLCALIYINGIVAIAVFVLSLLPILIAGMLGSKIQIRNDIYMTKLKKFNVRIADFIYGYTTVVVNHNQREQLQQLEAVNNEACDSQIKREEMDTTVSIMIGIFSYLGTIMIVIISVWQILSDKMSIGGLVAVFQISEMLVIPANSIASEISSIVSVNSIRKRIIGVSSQKEPQNKALQLDGAPDSIVLRDVSFHYEDKTILSHVDFQFEAGRKYLIIGENGSGKSTFFRILSHIEDGYQGNIVIQGKELRELDESYYDYVGVVLQDTYMFNDTFRHNLDLYRDIPEERMNTVIHELKLTRLYEKDALDTVYSDAQNNLSGGEKQKIAIARLLLQDKKIIMLDEATASVDQKSSYFIEKMLLEREDVTLISIEHKLQTELLSKYDTIIKIDHGMHVISHEELLPSI